MASLLLVDDELAVRRSLRPVLEGEGYAVRVARNADEAMACLAELRPDLVLLDVMMPGRNGFAVCDEIRRTDARLPILFLTALDSEADKVRAFGLGADDFMAKTVGNAELLARIRRALERARTCAAGGSDANAADELHLGRIRVDFARRTVCDERGVLERLSTTETDMLRVLSASRGRVFSPDEIATALRGEGYAVEGATLRSQICRLKTKLGPAGDMLVNKRGSGYALIR